MIWLGRLISIPLGVVFFVLLLATLIILQVDGSFLDPDYYPEELRKANIYEFVLVDLVKSAIDEVRERQAGDSDEGLDTDFLISSGLTTEDIVSALNRAVPPEWVQGLVEESFDQFGKYLSGERDDFEVTLRAGEQAATLVSEVMGLLRKADAYNLVYDEVVIPAIEDALDASTGAATVRQELPLGVDVSNERLVEAVRAVAPADWVQSQIESVIDEVTPYLLGQQDSFEIRLQVGDRVAPAVREIKALLRETDAYNVLYSEVVEPKLVEALGDSVELPFGVSITNEEVLSALRQVAPVEWVQQQVERLIDDVGPYLAGQTDSFATDVSLVENKRQARDVIARLVTGRITELVGGIPQCRSQAEAGAALLNRDARGLPSCVPAGTSIPQLLERLDIDIAGGVTQFVLGPIPDRIDFSDTQLRQAVTLASPLQGEEFLEALDNVRDILGGGWSFTQEDLHERLGDDPDTREEYLEKLDGIRRFLAEGETYTAERFRRELTEGGCFIIQCWEASGDTADVPDDLENVRDVLKLARTYKWVIYIPLVLLIFIIAFLGGRSWSGRISYGAAFVFIFAGITFVGFGPVYDAVAEQGFERAREEALKEADRTSTDFPETSRMAAEKLIDVGESVAGGFAGGIATSSRNLTILGLLVFATAIFWSAIMGVVDRLFPDKGRELKRWRG